MTEPTEKKNPRNAIENDTLDDFDDADKKPSRRDNKKKSPGKKGMVIALIVVLVALVGVGGFFGIREYQRIANHNKMVKAVDVATFYPGITIDGVDVSGMTYDQALEHWGNLAKEKRESFGITIKADDQTLVINDVDAGVSFDTAKVLEEAYNTARTGDLVDRYALVTQIASEGRAYTTAMTYDEESIRSQITLFAEKFAVEPLDATVASFDAEKKVFSFSAEVDGRIPNAEEAAGAALAFLANGQYAETVDLTYTQTPAKVKRENLMENFGLRASFSTSTTSDSNRNTNIRLACEAITGKLLKPGEVFSFNDTTGERSRSKGYRDAGAIQNGVLIKEPGGGVCQVSGTLFNAVARADLEIVTRHNHTWPSSYVRIGMDAAVDFPSTDFKFKNTTEEPIYVWMYYKSQKLHAEIYGLKLEEGLTIDLESEHTGYSSPKSPQITVNNSLAPGKKVTVREERRGQGAVTYRVYYKNGERIRRELLFRSYYPSVQGIYEIGPEAAPSTSPPTSPTKDPDTSSTPKPSKDPTPTKAPDPTKEPDPETQPPEETDGE